MDWRLKSMASWAVVMVLAGVWHAVYVTTTRRGRELIRDLFPRWSDLADMGKMLRYNLGLCATKTALWSVQLHGKAEYWALLWGGL
ncbi:MAG: cytochrome B, partial [Bdellovibrionaceae bacterium]|nr:cytochrome B [Pseudobdellovibrionaceae bacterium]